MRGVLDRLLADLPGVVYRCLNDEQWTMRGLTANVDELTGWTVEELVQNAERAWVDLIHPDDREGVREAVERAVERNESFQVAYRITTRAGEERWVLEEGRAVEKDGEEVLTGYIQDITTSVSERIEEVRDDLASIRDDLSRVRREREHLELLQSVTRLINRERSLEDALASVIPEICQALTFSVGHAFLLGQESGGLTSSDIWFLDEETEGLEAFVEATDGEHWDPEEGLPGRVMASSRAEWVEDVESDPTFYRVSEDRPSPIHSGVGVPVMSEDRCLAVVEFYHDRSVSRDPALMETLEQIGVQLGRVWERQEADREQRVSQQLFRELAERGEMVFWISERDGKVVYASPGFQALMGGDPKTSLDLTHWRDLLGFAHPEDREKLVDLLSRPDRAPYEIQYRIVRPGGEVRWLHQKAFPMPDRKGHVTRIGGLVQDVTEPRRSRVRLEETSRLLEQTFASLEEAVFVIDTSGEGRGIVEANPMAEEIFGYDRDELVGDTTEKLHVDEVSFHRFHEESVPRLEEEGIFRATFPLKRKDGTVFAAEQTVTLLDPDRGLPGGAVSVVRDVSEQKELERQLLQAQKMEAVGRLAGGIAHDFNNLLTVIRGEADFLLLDMSSQDPLFEEIRIIRDAADRAARLTNQLLAFSREQVLQPRVVDLNEIVEDIRHLLRRVLPEDIQIRTELGPGLPPVHVDPGQLEQVIMNLAVNARDAMPDGGALTLSTGLETAAPGDVRDLSGREGEVGVGLTVSDTGVGMEADVRAQVFEPFFTTKGDEGGTGLGLSMTYGIVRQSGGTIEVESEPGEGTTFTMVFPPATGTAEALPDRGEPRLFDDMTGTVLVVEDDPSVLRVTRRILERAGLDVRVAPDAETALEELEEAGEEIDLVLTDLVLPGLGGRALVDRVRDELEHVRVVVMSGYAEGSPGQRGDLPPEIGFIQKPFTPEGLVEIVRRKLGEEG